MNLQIVFPHGNTEENDLTTLPEGAISVDIERKALRIHDGVTPGGFEILGQQAYTPPEE